MQLILALELADGKRLNGVKMKTVYKNKSTGVVEGLFENCKCGGKFSDANLYEEIEGEPTKADLDSFKVFQDSQPKSPEEIAEETRFNTRVNEVLKSKGLI